MKVVGTIVKNIKRIYNMMKDIIQKHEFQIYNIHSLKSF